MLTILLLPESLALKVNAVQTNVTDGYHLPDAAAIEAQITPRTKAVLLTNPGNPTGVVYTQEEMDMISVNRPLNMTWL